MASLAQLAKRADDLALEQCRWWINHGFSAAEALEAIGIRVQHEACWRFVRQVLAGKCLEMLGAHRG